MAGFDLADCAAMRSALLPSGLRPMHCGTCRVRRAEPPQQGTGTRQVPQCGSYALCAWRAALKCRL